MSLFPHQIRAWQSKKRIIALVGGTGAGKTWFAPIWVYKKVQTPETRVLCIGMGYDRHVSRVMMFELTKFFRNLGQKYKLNERKGELLLPNGSMCLFGSSDNPLSLEGPHLDAAWIDEAGLMPRMAWDVAQRRTGRAQGQILITTIPYFEGWLKSDVFDAWAKGDPDIDWIACKTSDNATYPPEEIERFRRIWRPEKFDIFFNGNWARPAGLIWPEPSDADVVVDPFIIPADWPAFAAHDYGWNAPTTGVWGRLSPDDVLYIVADYTGREETIETHVNAWRQRGLHGVDEVWGDPANPEVWARATELGYSVSTGNNNVPAGIDEVYTRLVTGRLKIFKGCSDLIDARATYRWAHDPKDEDVLIDRPLKPQPAEHLCLAVGTQILLRRGEVPIERVKVGDQALTESGWRPVVAAAKTGEEPLIVVSLSNGRELAGTDDHPVWTQRGWVPLGALRYSDILSVFRPNTLPRNAVPVHVVGSRRAGRNAVYNLTIEGEHEYYASGVLTSNCDALRYLCMGIADYGVGYTSDPIMLSTRSSLIA